MKLLELIGLPVYDIETGKRLSKVRDIWLSEQWEITHLELEGRTIYSRTIPVVAWEHVVACGEETVMLKSQELVHKVKGNSTEQARTFLQGPHRIKELPVITTEGSQLGRVADVYFQPQLGNTITGLEITDGLLSDLLEGRIQFEGTGLMGTDAIIVT
ncbi:PRC-barrel domain-containing protein [Paenibacillus marinisediminis]